MISHAAFMKLQAEHQRNIERDLEEAREQRLRRRSHSSCAEDYAVGVYDWTLGPDELYLAGAQADYQQTRVEYVLDNWAYPGRHDRPPRRLHRQVEDRRK